MNVPNPAPSFERLADQHAVVLAGRVVAVDCTVAKLREMKEAVTALAHEHGLPLALVTTSGWDHGGDKVWGPAFVGRVLLSVPMGQEPVPLDASIFGDTAIPDAVWEALAAHATEREATSVYLLPTGWSQALLCAGELVSDEHWDPDDGDWEGEVDGEEIAVVSSEDSEPFELGEEAMAAVRDKTAYLWSVYI